MSINQKVEIDFSRCFKALIVHIRFIIAATFLFLILGVLGAHIIVPKQNTYSSKSSVYSIGYGEGYDNSAEGIKTMKAYADIIKSLKVAERASLLLGDDTITKFDIYDMIEVQYDIQTNTYSSIINILANTDTEEKAIKVANAVANAFVLEIATVEKESKIQLLDKAYTAELIFDSEKQQILYAAAITVGGLLLACAFIFLREIFSLKMYKVKDGTLYGKLNIIGVIPEYEKD